MGTLSHQNQQVTPILNGAGSRSQQDTDELRALITSSGLWQTAHEDLVDLTCRLFKLAGWSDRAVRAALAVSSALPRNGKQTKLAHATIGSRISRAPNSVSRYIDELQEAQKASGFEFVSVERAPQRRGGTPTEKGKFKDNWRRRLYEEYENAVRLGTWSNDWGRGGPDTPANLSREAVAESVLNSIPKIEKEAKVEVDEDTREAHRRKAALFEPRIRKCISELIEMSEIDLDHWDIAAAELDRLNDRVPRLLAKASRRIADARNRFTQPLHDIFLASIKSDEPDAQEESSTEWLPCHGSDQFPLPCTEVGIPTTSEKNNGCGDSDGTPLNTPDNAVFRESDPVSPLNETEAPGVFCHEKVDDEDTPEADPRNNFWAPPTEETRLQAALSHAALGRKIVPVYGLTPEGFCQCWKGKDCRSAGKHPGIIDWVNKASCDPDQVEEWFTKWPASNLGWAMGGGFLALDFDGPEGQALYQGLWDAGAFPPTLEQTTGSGGIHLIFRDAPDLPNAVRLASGLDLRSAGGQILIAPSVTTRGPYTWRPGPTDPVSIPPRLLEWIEMLIEQEKEAKGFAKQAAAQRMPAGVNGYSQSSICSLPDVIPEGERNTQMRNWLRGRRNSVADPALLLSMALEKNMRHFSPPLPEAEVVEMVQRTCRKFQPVMV